MAAQVYLKAQPASVFHQAQRPSFLVVESYAALGAPTQLHDEIQEMLERQRDVEDGATLTETFFAVVKSFFGATVLYLPYTIAQAGTLASFVIMLLAAALCIFACLRLIRIADAHAHLSGYGQIAEAAMGPRARTYIQVSLVLVQCGFALTYYVFVARNIHNVMQVFQADEHGLSIGMVIGMLAVLQIPAACIIVRNLSMFFSFRSFPMHSPSFFVSALRYRAQSWAFSKLLDSLLFGVSKVCFFDCWGISKLGNQEKSGNLEFWESESSK